MSDFFTTFAASAPLWLLPLVCLVYVWGKIVKAGLNPEHEASFQRTVDWLRQDNVGQLYLVALGWLMDRVGNWIGDRQKLGVSYAASAKPKAVTTTLFGFNPFTPESYEKCLLLAFSYPVLSFLGAWVLGVDDQFGNTNFLTNLSTETVMQRSLIVGGAFLLFGCMWLLIRQKGWRQYLYLALIFAFFILALGLLKVSVDFLEQYFRLWGYFLLFFVMIYSGGWITEAIISRSKQQAHNSIYKPAFYLAFVLSFIFILIFVGSGSGSGSGSAAAVAIVAVAVVMVAVVAVAGAGAGVVVTVAAVIVNVAIDVAFDFDFAFDIAAAVAVAVAVAVAAVGATIVTLRVIQQWSEKCQIIGMYWIIYSWLFFTIGAISLYFIKDSGYMVLILLWLLLPLVNAPLDWLSLGVTRGLLQAMRSGKHASRAALSWAILDLGMALLFLFLITAVLVGVTAFGNWVSGETLVDIQSILNKVKAAPTGVSNWWIYFMLLSTLLPTLVHFALAGGAATLWLPRKWRLSIADGLEKDSHKTHVAWAYLTFTPIIGFIVVPAGLLFFLWWLVNVNGGWLGGHLFDWAQWLATTAGTL